MASKNRPASAPEPRKYELKHRLTGATILVSTAVIAIPLLLKDPNKPVVRFYSVPLDAFEEAEEPEPLPDSDDDMRD